MSTKTHQRAKHGRLKKSAKEKRAQMIKGMEGRRDRKLRHEAVIVALGQKVMEFEETMVVVDEVIDDLNKRVIALENPEK